MREVDGQTFGIVRKVFYINALTCDDDGAVYRGACKLDRGNGRSTALCMHHNIAARAAYPCRVELYRAVSPQSSIWPWLHKPSTSALSGKRADYRRTRLCGAHDG